MTKAFSAFLMCLLISNLWSISGRSSVAALTFIVMGVIFLLMDTLKK